MGEFTMIQRVYMQARQSTSLDAVVVATDDRRIAENIRDIGGEVSMTRVDHHNGTSRCAEVAQNLEGRYFINIQGDEPFINPRQIDLLADRLSRGALIATLKKKIHEQKELMDPNVVKVVTDLAGKAIYFSRQPIPHLQGTDMNTWLANSAFHKHIGIYGFERNTLMEVVDLPETKLEKCESLEQLRWMEHGKSIYVEETQSESISIDTPADLEDALRLLHEER